MAENFQVICRNSKDHWDIYLIKGPRIFRIRGIKDNYVVLDERKDEVIPGFKTVRTAMYYICSKLM